MYNLGPKAEDVLSALNLSDDEQKVYPTVTAHFEEHFVLRRNIIWTSSFSVAKSFCVAAFQARY